MDTLRPLPMFLGISGPAFCFSAGAFNPPSKHFDKATSEKVFQRINLNFSFFLTNYALVTFGTALVVTLMHPIMIMYVGIVWLLWSTHFLMVQHNIPLVVLDQDLGNYFTVEMRSTALWLISMVVVVCYCLLPFLMVVGVSALIILTHAIMRDPKHIENTKSFRRFSEDSDEETSSTEEVMVNKADLI